MDIRERHIGTISRRIGDDDQEIDVDVGILVRRILLFEHCTLESDNLREIPALVRIFGAEGLKGLLASGALSIICDALTMGSIGQTTNLQVTMRRGGPLPFGSYRIVPVSLAEREQHVHQALQHVHDAPGMDLKQQIKLKKYLVPLLGAYPRELALESRASFLEIIERSDPVITQALTVAYHEAKRIPLPEGVRVQTEDLGNDGDFRVISNLSDLTGLGAEEAHKIMERALLGAAGLEQRLVVMRSFNSLSGFRDNEVPVFEKRLSWLGEQLDPATQERRFERVIQVAGLPGLDDLPAGQRINVERLLELRESSECVEFRRWLREIDAETDREIAERFASIKERLAAITQTKTVKTARFIVEAGVGAIPVVGLVASPGLTLLDSFISEKLIGRPGPVSFLSRSYPSIFQGVQVPLSALLDGEGAVEAPD